MHQLRFNDFRLTRQGSGSELSSAPITQVSSVTRNKRRDWTIERVRSQSDRGSWRGDVFMSGFIGNEVLGRKELWQSYYR